MINTQSLSSVPLAAVLAFILIVASTGSINPTAISATSSMPTGFDFSELPDIALNAMGLSNQSSQDESEDNDANPTLVQNDNNTSQKEDIGDDNVNGQQQEQQEQQNMENNLVVDPDTDTKKGKTGEENTIGPEQDKEDDSNKDSVVCVTQHGGNGDTEQSDYTMCTNKPNDKDNDEKQDNQTPVTTDSTTEDNK